MKKVEQNGFHYALNTVYVIDNKLIGTFQGKVGNTLLFHGFRLAKPLYGRLELQNFGYFKLGDSADLVSITSEASEAQKMIFYKSAYKVLKAKLDYRVVSQYKSLD